MAEGTIMKMDFQTFIEAYWKYYLTLEHRLLKTEEYVAFDEFNNKTYSIEYLSLLQIICSEIDVVAKAIALFHNPDFKADNSSIKKWGFEVQQAFNDIDSQIVIFRDLREFSPWGKWKIVTAINKNGQKYYKYTNESASPGWWNAYTKVKHARTSIENEQINYYKANQINVLTSLAALFSLNRLMMRELDAAGYVDIERSTLFAMHGWNDEIRESMYFAEDGHVSLRYKTL